MWIFIRVSTNSYIKASARALGEATPGAPGAARTRDPLLKRQVLLPTELLEQIIYPIQSCVFVSYFLLPFLSCIYIITFFFTKIKKDFLVPKAGLEPARPHGHLILSQARLPIPPLGHNITDHPQA